MLQVLWLIPAIPFIGAFLLLIFGRDLPRRLAAVIGVASIGISAALSLATVPAFLASGGPYTQTLWTWIDAGGFRPEIAFYLDPVSLLMIVVVTFVAFLIHLYSSEFMEEDDGYARFFAFMNLFVGSMLVLVLANNLLLLFLGWEGVGLCSYLLIGFWYRDPANGRAARKAFIVTRVGDTAMMIGLFVLFHYLGTLQIQDLMRAASAQWPVGSALPTLAAALLLGGAVGKSAQLPLQTWLPDAMAGPTPTSALIHAATMVTAGVYLIVRTHVLFTLAPDVQLAVAIIGAATLLLAGCSALTQSDIKRVLAYSTVSQIGYMFLALGVGSWAAGMFHFMTHAFFKALLFLGAGIVIQAQHEEHNMFRMGGLRRELPIAFWTFLIAGCSLAGLPLVTAGYFSKDFILWSAWTSPEGSAWLWVAGIVGVLLTGLYTFRLIFLVFFGPRQIPVTHRPGFRIALPAIVLAILSVAGGWFRGPLLVFLGKGLPQLIESRAGLTEILSGGIAALAFLVGLLLAYGLYIRKREYAATMATSGFSRALHDFWFEDWGFDWLYDRLFVRPFLWVARMNRRDAVDRVFDFIAELSRDAHHALSLTESGRLRWYAAGIGAGAVIFLGVALLR